MKSAVGFHMHQMHQPHCTVGFAQLQLIAHCSGLPVPNWHRMGLPLGNGGPEQKQPLCSMRPGPREHVGRAQTHFSSCWPFLEHLQLRAKEIHFADVSILITSHCYQKYTKYDCYPIGT